MKTVTDKLNMHPYTSKLFNMYFGGKRLAVFDIETTGLSPAFCKVILSGILLCEENSCRIIQYFADCPENEKEIIEKTLEILSDADCILTYNGRHFDLPFMQTRAKKHGISFEPAAYNLDLFLVIQGHSVLRDHLPNLKQKTIEVFMGLSDSRADEISGGESVSLYEQYMQTRSLALEEKILLHNHDDLIQLYRLLPVIEKTDFHGAMYKLGFPAGQFQVQKIQFQGRSLHVLGKQLGKARDYISFPTAETPCSLLMNSAGSDFELTVPFENQNGALYFDAAALLNGKTAAIEKYPSVVDGYLIASDHGKVSHTEINHFLLEFFQNLRLI